MFRITRSLAILGGLVVAVALTSSTAEAQTLPVTGTDGVYTLTGELSNLTAVVQNGVATIEGTLNGTVTNAAGTVVGTITDLLVQLPILGGTAQAACTILTLSRSPN